MSTTADRIAVVTGASSGIGKETTKALRARGWRVIGVGRDPARTAAAEEEIRAIDGPASFDMIRADLALTTDARHAAAEIGRLTDRVHVLVNNAGGMAREKVVTAEGLEANFAGNHLGPFLLTKQLLPLLKRASAEAPEGTVRIVNTASDASEMIPAIDWADWQCLERFSAGRAYCQAKLANVLHARGLARQLGGSGIMAFSVHPGTVATNFASHAEESTRKYIATLEAISPEEGADTVIWLASTEEPLESGGYYYRRRVRTPNPVVDDDAVVQRLWEESERLLGDVEG